jgi:alpha-tubulin suppressor-like RCC1 family protein
MLCVFLGGLVACGSGTSGPDDPDGSVVSVTVAPASPSLLAGQTQQMAARDQAGRLLTGSGVTWGTSASSVATVSAAGLVTGVGGGTATISATAQGKQGSTSATVTALQIAALAAGGAHTCAITATGTTWCWGRGELGQLGGTPPPTQCPLDEAPRPCSLFPVPVQGSQVLTRLDAGPEHTCGLTASGAAWCWGRNFSGQLGDNGTTNRSTPVAVVGGHTFAMLNAGQQHTCALTAAGAAYCWGLNSAGQLGDGTTINRWAPVAVTGGHVFESIAAGGAGNGITCALTAAGAAWCWGQNSLGELGIGTMDVFPHSAPVPVTGGIVFDSLSAGSAHVCGLTAAGTAWCWGSNDLGELGNGTLIPSAVPVQVAGGLAFAQITAGGFNIVNAHTCARTSAGAAYCWGENEVGALGDGTVVNRPTPTAVTGSLAFASLSAGYRHTCGLAGGRLYCWGSNGAGQLGINSVVAQSVPTSVLGQP